MRTVTTLVLLLAASPVPVLSQTDQEPRRVNGGQVAAQAVLGMGGGLAGLFIGGRLGATGSVFDTGEISDLGGAVIGAVAGLVIGTAGGVQLGGLVGKGKGAFPASALGSFLGTLALFGVGGLVGSESVVLPVMLFALPATGSIIAYQVSSARREQRPSMLDRVNLGFGPTPSGGAGIALRVTF